MRAFRDFGWPHLVSADRLHTSRSTPVLKHTDSARPLQNKKIQANGSHLRRSSEGSDASPAMRALLPSPIVDSRESSEPSIDFPMTRSPHSVPGSPPERSKSGVYMSDPTVALSLSMDESKLPALPNTAEEAFKTRQAGKETLNFDEAIDPLEKVYGLRFDVEHDFQEVTDSVKPLAVVALSLSESDSKAGPAVTSTPRIEVTRPSIMLDVSPLVYRDPKSQSDVKYRPNSSSSTSSNKSAPSIHDAFRSTTPVIATAPQSPSLDGPAPELPSLASGDLETTGNGGSAADVGAGVIGAVPTGRPTDIVPALPSCCPVPGSKPTDINLPSTDTDGLPALAETLSNAPDAAIVAGRLEVPTALKLPGQPIDQTGLVSLPPSPKPNLTKKQKAKFKTQKLIRTGRRVVLRKSVLSIVLGRQLAGPTATILKVISRGGQVPDAGAIVGRATGVVPNSVPVPLPI